MSYHIEDIEFETAHYVADPGESPHSVKLVLTTDSQVYIPIDLGNRQYAKLMRLVDEEGLPIHSAE